VHSPYDDRDFEDFDEEAPTFDVGHPEGRGLPPEQPPRQPSELNHIFHDNFGFFFSWKKVILLLLLLVVLAIVFVIHFGTNLNDISCRVKQGLHTPCAPLQGRVLADPAVTAVKLRYVQNNTLLVANVQLLGLSAPGRCYRGDALKKILPPQGLVDVNFDYAHMSASDGQLQVILTHNNSNLNLALLQAGAARVDVASATSSDVLGIYESAQSAAEHAHRGLWRTCRS
jgi:hypothetical protein